jgi:hypothetical protein
LTKDLSCVILNIRNQTKLKGVDAMRTNNKLFKEQIRNHILDILSTDETQDVKTQLQIVLGEFNNWYNGYERNRNPNIQDGFIDFLMGLPSCISVEYSNYNIRQELKSWWENAGGEFDESKVEGSESDLYFPLIYREYRKLCEQYGVDFEGVIY